MAPSCTVSGNPASTVLFAGARNLRRFKLKEQVMTSDDSLHAHSARDKKNPVEFDRFAEDVEKHANIMQQAGWVQDATNLRKWARELRDRSTRAVLP